MDMPDLPEDHTPQDMITGISIDIQLPTGASDVRCVSFCSYSSWIKTAAYVNYFCVGGVWSFFVMGRRRPEVVL